MKNILGLFLLGVTLTASNAHACDWLWGAFASPCNGIAKAYRTGDDELLLSGYAYHIRSSYTPEKIREFNENAWGIGYAKTAEETNGDSHSLFWLVFKDSHHNNQYHFGYNYQTFWGPRSGAQLGLGYVAMIVQRPDIFNGVPFPAALPTVSAKWNNTAINVFWIPKINEKVNNGNVIYAFVRHTFK